jgi:uncharacterized protein YcsI (UPF0317 family)
MGAELRCVPKKAIIDFKKSLAYELVFHCERKFVLCSVLAGLENGRSGLG